MDLFFRGSKIGFLYVGSLGGIGGGRKKKLKKEELKKEKKTFANPSGPLIVVAFAITLGGSPRGEAYLLFFSWSRMRRVKKTPHSFLGRGRSDSTPPTSPLWTFNGLHLRKSSTEFSVGARK